MNEIVAAIRIPLWPAGHKAAFVEFSRRHGDFAIVSAAALLQIEGGKIARASVTVGGVAVAPVRASDVEAAITGQAPASDLFAKACESCRSIDAMADIHASADYRSMSQPFCRAARWRRRRGLPTTRRGNARSMRDDAAPWR